MSTTDYNMQARTNPVFLTAKTAVSLMSDADIEGASQIVEGLGIKNTSSVSGITDEATVLGNALVVEAKYRTMCQLIEDTGIKINVDLPCGYTPKALHLTQRGLRFVGLDLPIVVQEAEPIIRGLATYPQHMQFHGVDATNLESLENALQDVSGPLCISTEGMMMYFTQSETEVVISNIHQLLVEHGGCWITPDPEFILQFFLTFQSIWGEAGIRSLMASRDAATKQSDVVNLTNDFIMSPQDVEGTRAKAEALLQRFGLKPTRINLGDHMPELSAYRYLTPEQTAAFKEAMHSCNYWRITVADDHMRKQEAAPAPEKAEPFQMDCNMEAGTFRVNLQGRLDTITAPKLLEAWDTQKAQGEIVAVRLDCSRLQYVSSAGLRVFAIMQKALPSSRIELVGVSDEVRNILEITGFIDFFNVFSNDNPL